MLTEFSKFVAVILTKPPPDIMLSLFLKLPEFIVILPPAKTLPYSVAGLLSSFPTRGIVGSFVLLATFFESVTFVCPKTDLKDCSYFVSRYDLNSDLLLSWIYFSNHSFCSFLAFLLVCPLVLFFHPPLSLSSHLLAISDSDNLCPSQVS